MYELYKPLTFTNLFPHNNVIGEIDSDSITLLWKIRQRPKVNKQLNKLKIQINNCRERILNDSF